MKTIKKKTIKKGNMVAIFLKKCTTLLSFAGIQAGQDPVINFKVIRKCRRRQAGPIQIKW